VNTRCGVLLWWLAENWQMSWGAQAWQVGHWLQQRLEDDNDLEVHRTVETMAY
jgi:hypothetical protein